MNKIVYIGSSRDGGVFCCIKFDGQNLSITGVIGPRSNGDCRGSCGQIVMSDWEVKEYAPGWSADLVSQFRAIWKKWHLNDMTAGSPAQEAFLAANPPVYAYPVSHYEVACKALESAGLNPDPTYIHKGMPYKYGTAWLLVAVPAEVIQFLESLPDATCTPAWV